MSAKPAPAETPRPSRLTIGTVCKQLHDEFPDVSISKIRFLEDQKLITPRRTPGGYRLYSEDDIEQLREILRMQRDEFLPLRVIRQVIAQGRSTSGSGRRPRLVGAGEDTLSLEQLLSAADAVIEQLRSAPVEQALIDRSITKMRSYLYDSMTQFGGFGRANLIACFALFDDDPARINSLEANFRKVTPELIERTAREYLRKTNRTVLVLEAGAAASPEQPEVRK